MEDIPLYGTAIQQCLLPTFKAFGPLLVANKASIQSIPRTTYKYGTNARQNLDFYPPHSSSDSPILFFLYGGGLTRGDKILAHMPEGLAYHNLGTFFAKAGYTTIIMDYRRVNDAELGTGEDAVFPSGGEDIATALRWLEGHLKESGSAQRDVFLMGNSAGALHVTTFLLAPQFVNARKKILSGDGQIKLKGGILVSAPCHFQQALAGRAGMLKNYYGGAEEVEKRCPHGLLESFEAGGSAPRLLILIAEYDPEDEIVVSNKDFYKLAREKLGEDKVDWVDMPGHNHISPPLALSTGDAKGEKWGNDVVAWMQRLVLSCKCGSKEFILLT